MAGKVANIKVCSPLKRRSDLTGNFHAICHYSYNFPLADKFENATNQYKKASYGKQKKIIQ